SLTLSNSLTNSGADNTVTNTVAAGKTLNLGNVFLSETGAASGRTLTFAGTGTTVVSGVVADGGQPSNVAVTGGTVRLNGTNTYTGTTTVSGTGGVGSGGTLGGTGTISGTVTISSTTTTSQGGTVSPGNSAGTLNVANMVWNPLGQYTFEHDTANSAVGGGVN